jgi:hypothetical protein
MFNYNTLINKSTMIMPFHATFNYNPRVLLWSGVEHKFHKHLKNKTGKDTSFREYGTTSTRRETNFKFGPSWENAIIKGIPGTATYKIRKEVGNKKVKTVNM